MTSILRMKNIKLIMLEHDNSMKSVLDKFEKLN